MKAHAPHDEQNLVVVMAPQEGHARCEASINDDLSFLRPASRLFLALDHWRYLHLVTSFFGC
jgi:hypothetical protein